MCVASRLQPHPSHPWIPCTAAPHQLWHTSREACCDRRWFLRPQRQMALTDSCPRKLFIHSSVGVRGDDRVALPNPHPFPFPPWLHQNRKEMIA